MCNKELTDSIHRLAKAFLLSDIILAILEGHHRLDDLCDQKKKRGERQ